MSRFSVVIVTFNSVDCMDRCLSSLESAAGGEPVDVVVVDNASTDNSLDVVRRASPEAHLIENRTNAGYAAANNSGVRWLMERPRPPDYVLILNPDLELSPGTVLRLAQVMEEYSTVGGVSPVSVEEGLFPPPAPPRVRSLWGRTLSAGFGGHSRLLETDRLMGGCMLVRLEAFRKAGLMDEDYFLYWEETDWCVRARRAGFRFLFLLDEFLPHHLGEPERPHRVYYLNRNQVLFARKNLAWPWRPIFYLRRFLFSTLREFFSYARRGRWDLIRAGIRGWCRGLAGETGPGRVGR